MKSILVGIGGAMACLSLTGCLSMARGTTETVAIESTPSGARVTVEKDGALLNECSATPCFFVLKRKEPPYNVTVRKEGCGTVVDTLYRDHDTSKGLAGNLLGIGGLAGMAVDSVSGAGYSVKPNPLHVTLSCGDQWEL